MKKILSVLFILFFTASCCRKETNQRIEITQRYEDGKKKILCKYAGKGELETLIERVTYDKNGQIVKMENPVEQTAKMMWRHKNGMKKRETQYKGGKKHGKWREWYSNGRIKQERVYCRDKLVRRADYKRHITDESIYKDGKLFMAREYNEGIIVTEKTYQEGKLIKAVWFYPDGRASDEREYKNGKKHGEWVYWDRNGEIKKKSFYREGELIREMSR